MDEGQKRYEEATQAELRRLVSRAQAPGDAPLSEFGPWADYVQALREAHADGIEAVRRVFLSLTRLTPEIGALLASEPVPAQTGWEMDDLYDTVLPEPEWIIPGILPVGLATLAGRPKLGKSFLALQIAIAVGKGTRVLDREVEKRRVLYLALEDTPRRIQDRVKQQGARPPFNFRVEFEWPFLDEGGLSCIDQAIVAGGYRLVIVDTLSRVLGRADQMDEVDMRQLIGYLQDVTRRTGAAILTIDHHKKPSGLFADPIDDIMGSTAKSAMVDVAIGLYAERNKSSVSLQARGRDTSTIDLALAWDKQFYCWQVVGNGDVVRLRGSQEEILDAIRVLGELGEVTSTASIAQQVGRPRSNVNADLAALLQAGEVVKGPKQGRAVPYLLANNAGEVEL